MNIDIIGISKQIFGLWSYPDQSTEVGRVECNKYVHNRAIGIIIFAVLLFIFLVVIYFILSNALDNQALDIVVYNKKLLWVNSITLSGLLKTILCILLLTCLVAICYAFGIKKVWEARTGMGFVDVQEVIKMFNERYELDNRKCLDCEKYSDSEKLIIQGIKDKSHFSYIDYFKEATKKEPEDLEKIRTDFGKEEYKYANLLCVLSNPQYYTPSENERQLASLTEYFVKFYPFIGDQKQIKRIFSLSAIGGVQDVDYKAKSKWLFQYLLINYITGVTTLLLLDEDDLDLKIDYVVGKYPGKPHKLSSERVSYLSFEGKGIGKSKDGTIVCSDQLFTNILEADFYAKWEGYKQKDLVREKILVKKGNWKRLMEKLSLNDVEVIECFIMLINNIRVIPYRKNFNELHKQSLFANLQEVVKDSSFKNVKNNIIGALIQIQ